MIVPISITLKGDGKTYSFDLKNRAVLSTITVYTTDYRNKPLKIFPTCISQSTITFNEAPPKHSKIQVFYRTELPSRKVTQE